jgi:AAHS family benzoate transporter-like MFS transporter
MNNQVDVREIAQSARFSRFHAVILFWCVLILVLDGYDLAVVGAALPSIMKQMGVDAAKAGFMANCRSNRTSLRSPSQVYSEPSQS